MTLFSAPNDPWSHRTRIVLAEKAIEIDIVDVAPGKYPEDLLDLNPYHTTPTLVDRDLVLYDSRVIMEYLDERFPHPPLMPVDPVTRARRAPGAVPDRAGLVRHRAQDRERSGQEERRAQEVLRDNVLQSTDLFKIKPYFLSDEFSMVDATIAPILWRLPHYEIDLPPQAQPIVKYASLFSPAAFRESLSDAEQEMRLHQRSAMRNLLKRPYLLRAMHQWMMDNGHTPHVIVDAEKPGVDVPRAYVKDGKIVLEPVLNGHAAPGDRERLDRVRCPLRGRRASRALSREHGARDLCPRDG